MLKFSTADRNRDAAGRQSTAREPLSICRHNVYFYDNEELISAQVSWRLYQSLRAGRRCLLLTSRARRLALTNLLTRLGADVQRAEREGRWLTLDAHAVMRPLLGRRSEPLDCPMAEGWLRAVLMKAGAPALPEHAVTAATRLHTLTSPAPVYAFNEVVGLMVEAGRSDLALELESVWNALGRQFAFDLDCAYPIEALAAADSAPTFAAICRAHHEFDCLEDMPRQVAV